MDGAGFITVGRLKKRPDFLKANAANRKWVTPGLIMQARARPAGEKSPTDLRVGFTVSKKVGNSVQRNRARRRLRAIAAELAGPGTSYNLTGHDLVVIGRAGTLTRDFDDLRRDFEQALHRLKLSR